MGCPLITRGETILSSFSSKHITAHSLRKTFGSRLYEATSDLYLVAETLGHSSVETTKRHYADITNKHKEEARNVLSLSSKNT